ncbi:MAG TPA: HAMP domain-containing sensor histidine kinase, partial [Patescibacteria group bacterium]|nr:HAMP domain-containing sensor histidine kinase [Patescibacteria group bacterium]
RDGQMMGAVAAVQFAEDKANDESITSLEDPSEQIQLALKISSRLHSVLGVRLFSADGKFLTAFPQYITETNLPQADLQALQALQPVSHFVPKAQMDEQDLLAGTNTEAVPLLVVNVPLREETTNRLDGIAQFLVYGSEIAREYAVLDRHLATQGILVFLISGSIVTAGLLLAFRRVEKANRLLAQRTGNLLKANRELALAAKTSAIGAVTSHLIHGLKNPLSGLRTFVQDRATAPDAALEDEWQLAAATTQRMQSLIDRVVRVLQEQQTATDYEITFAELIEILSSKLRPLAESAGVNYRADADLAGSMSNRQADLLLLILENLVQNAIEATPPGKRVNLRVFCDGSRAVMEIQDEGPGMPPDLLEKLFAPCPSAKKGGSGIGLAISRQLAAHLGATLDLKQTSAAGCCFRIVLPLAAAAEPDPEDSRVAAIARGESTEASIGALAKKSNP